MWKQKHFVSICIWFQDCAKLRHCHHSLSAHFPTSQSATISRFPCNFFCQRDSQSNLAEYPRSRVRKIRNDASSCPGIFSITLCFYSVTSSPGHLLHHLLDWHRDETLSLFLCGFLVFLVCLRVEFLLKTESGYLRDAEVTWFTLANP